MTEVKRKNGESIEVYQRRVRAAELATWTRCAFCWRPLTDDAVKEKGKRYCDMRCAKGVIAGSEPVEDDAPVEVHPDQMELA